MTYQSLSAIEEALTISEDDPEFLAALERAQELALLQTADQFGESVIDRLFNQPEIIGPACAITKLQDVVRFPPGQVTLWYGPNGHGKAEHVDTEILTTSGFKRMGDLEPGDLVFDESGMPTEVVACTPVQSGRPVYELEFSDGTRTVADENHLWVTKTQRALASERHAKRNAVRRDSGAQRVVPLRSQAHKRTFQSVVSTKDIAETLVTTKPGGQRINNHAIKVCGALQMPAANLPLDPYVLGVWLGDGCSTHGSYVYGEDIEVFDGLTSRGHKAVNVDGKFKWRVDGLRVAVRELGLLGNKMVPQEYLLASQEQRLDLLRGLMDTDGHCAKDGRAEFCSMSKALADAVEFLACSLGIIAVTTTGTATLNGKDCGTKYRVSFTTSLRVFNIKRKAERQPKETSTRASHRWVVACRKLDTADVRCIQVAAASHQYLTGRRLVPTHNSLITSQMALDMAMLGEPVLICSFEMAPVATLVRMIKQSASTGAVTRRWAEAFLSWAQSKVWVYNKRGQASSEKLLRLAAFAAERHGIKHVFIDSLMKCVAGEDDYNGQKDFVDQCCVLAMAAGVHVHLVHHIRKPSDETQMFSKFDVKGSGAIVDQVDCAIGVWRNKRKEEKRRQGKLAEDEESLPDAVLIVDKNRHIECEGKFGLYYVPGAQSYTDFRGRPVRYDLGEHWEDGEVRV